MRVSLRDREIYIIEYSRIETRYEAFAGFVNYMINFMRIRRGKL